MKTFEKQFAKVLERSANQIIAAVGKVDEMALALEMQNETLRILSEAGYDEVVANYLAEESNIIKQEKLAMKKRPIPMKFAKADVAQIEALQNKELMNLMNLKTDMAMKIQELTAQGVMTNMSDLELAKQIGKIKDVQERYTKTYVRTARNQYTQKLHDLSAQRYEERTGEEVYWRYIGPQDDITRPECELAVEKEYFTTQEKEDFENGAMFDAGVPRWNCRHTFIEVTKRDYEEAMGTGAETVEDKEQQILDETGNKYEKAVVYDKDGNIILEKDGIKDKVRFSPEEQVKMRGAKMFTHNHPSGSSFSASDISTGLILDIEEIRAVGDRYLYRMKPKPIQGYTSPKDIIYIIDELQKRADNIVREGLQDMIDAGTITVKEAKKMHQHLAMTRIAKYLGWKYERINRKI